MSLLVWIVLGGLAGWVASLIMGTDARQGLVGNIVVGVVGALLGGWIMSLFGFGDVNGFNFYSFIVAVLGAVILLFLWNLISGRRSAGPGA